MSVVSLRPLRYGRRFHGAAPDGRTTHGRRFREIYDATCAAVGGESGLSAFDRTLVRSIASLSVAADRVAAKIGAGEIPDATVLVTIGEQIASLTAQLARGRAE
jgi:hypothetical protein